MPRKNDNGHPAFTLVELILVMALLAMIMALAAPSLARTFRQRTLEQEGTRLLALTEFARDEAVSQGVPMVIWIDAEDQRFGAGAKTGYVANTSRRKEFSLHPDVQFDSMRDLKDAANAIEFSPDGTPDPASLTSVRLMDRFNSTIVVQKATDGLSYEIVKEEGK